MASRRASVFGGGIRSTLVRGALVAGIAVFGLSALDGTELPAVAEGRIPAVAHEAYRAASAAAHTVAEGCDVDWAVLAAIAQEESAHGRVHGGELAPDGDIQPPIRGLALDGSGATRAVPDTDSGVLDGDPTWDRAMGPFQFIPSSWRRFGRDGNGDGVANPDNVYDAALAATAHLCVLTPGDYADRGDLRAALLVYNESGRYADDVLGWVEVYRTEPPAEVIEERSPG